MLTVERIWSGDARGGTPYSWTTGDVPLDGVAFSGLNWLKWGYIFNILTKMGHHFCVTGWPHWQLKLLKELQANPRTSSWWHVHRSWTIRDSTYIADKVFSTANNVLICFITSSAKLILMDNQTVLRKSDLDGIYVWSQKATKPTKMG